MMIARHRADSRGEPANVSSVRARANRVIACASATMCTRPVPLLLLLISRRERPQKAARRYLHARLVGRPLVNEKRSSFKAYEASLAPGAREPRIHSNNNAARARVSIFRIM